MSSSAVTAGMKPMSAMWSASSRTTTSTSDEVGVALLDEVGEPARRGDDDLDAAAQRLGLLRVGHATDDGLHAQAHACGRAARARRSPGRRARGSGRGRRRSGRRGWARAAGEPGEHREAEGEGLAGARTAAAEDVATGEGVGDRGGLDRERLGDAGAGQRGDERLREAELAEARQRAAGAVVGLDVGVLMRRRTSRDDGAVPERPGCGTPSGFV